MVAPYTAPESAAVEGAARLHRAPFFSAPRSVALYGAQGAPRAPLNSLGEQPKTTENSPETEFSILWKHFFHCVEKRRNIFPLCGKIGLFFPQCGNIFSIVWKNREIVFHTVENVCGPVPAILRS